MSLGSLLLAALLFLPEPYSPLPVWFPALIREEARPLNVLVVDVSESVRRRHPDWRAAVTTELRELAAELDERAPSSGFASSIGNLAVIAYAEGAQLCFGPADPEALVQGAAAERAVERMLAVTSSRQNLAAPASRLDRALVLVRSLETQDSPAEPEFILNDIWVWTDGANTHGQVDPAINRITSRSKLEGSPFGRSLADVCVTGLRLPENPTTGVPMSCEVQLSACLAGKTAQSQVALSNLPELLLEVQRFEQDGSVTREEFRRAVDWELLLRGGKSGETSAALAGWRSLTLTTSIGPAASARTVVRARFEANWTDCVPENDEQVASCTSRDVLRGAWVDASEGGPAAQTISSLPITPGVAWQVLSISDFLQRPADFDVLWSLDLAQADLVAVGPQAEATLAAFLHNGGGWLAHAGWRSLGDPPGLLPLDFELPDEPARHVLLLVDGSGSMAGEPFERLRETVLDLAPNLPKQDRLSLRFFNDGLNAGPDAGLLLQPGEDRTTSLEELRERLAKRVPGGRTNMILALEQLLEEFAAQDRELAEARDPERRLVLLLTDGVDEERAPLSADERLALWKSLGQERAELVSVFLSAQVGAQPTAFLSALMGSESGVELATDPTRLREILRRQWHAASVEKGDWQAHPVAGLPAGWEDLGAWQNLAKVKLESLQELIRARECFPAVLLSAEFAPLLGNAGSATQQPGEAHRLLGTLPGGDGELLMAGLRLGRGRCVAVSSPLRAWGVGQIGSAQTETSTWGALVRGIARQPAAAQLRCQAGNLTFGPLLDQDRPDPKWPALLRAEFRALNESVIENGSQAAVLWSAQLSLPSGGVLDPRFVRRGAWPGGGVEGLFAYEIFADAEGASDTHTGPSQSLAPVLASGLMVVERAGEFDPPSEPAEASDPDSSLGISDPTPARPWIPGPNQRRWALLFLTLGLLGLAFAAWGRWLAQSGSSSSDPSAA